MHGVDSEERCRQDLDLVRRTLRGDGRGLTELSRRLRCVPRFLRYHNRRHGGRFGGEELDDLLQDTLLVIWRKLGNFSGASSLEAWAHRVVTLEFLARSRRSSRALHALPVEPEAMAARSTRDPYEYEDVHLALRRIGRDEATVLRLKHFEGLTFSEIGQRLDVSPNTIKARYYRGVQELRPLLRTRGGPES